MEGRNLNTNNHSSLLTLIVVTRLGEVFATEYPNIAHLILSNIAENLVKRPKMR